MIFRYSALLALVFLLASPCFAVEISTNDTLYDEYASPRKHVILYNNSDSVVYPDSIKISPYRSYASYVKINWTYWSGLVIDSIPIYLDVSESFKPVYDTAYDTVDGIYIVRYFYPDTFRIRNCSVAGTLFQIGPTDKRTLTYSLLGERCNSGTSYSGPLLADMYIYFNDNTMIIVHLSNQQDPVQAKPIILIEPLKAKAPVASSFVNIRGQIVQLGKSTGLRISASMRKIQIVSKY